MNLLKNRKYQKQPKEKKSMTFKGPAIQLTADLGKHRLDDILKIPKELDRILKLKHSLHTQAWINPTEIYTFVCNEICTE
jgi:hypothetical protein